MTTFLTITSLLLAMLLGATIVGAVRNFNRADNLLRTNKALNIQLNAYREANIDPRGIYSVQRVTTEMPEFREYNGRWGVCRITMKRGYTFKTTIKVFIDEDDDFNLREAQELCDKLNEN